jgi:hypothetical protein
MERTREKASDFLRHDFVSRSTSPVGRIFRCSWARQEMQGRGDPSNGQNDYHYRRNGLCNPCGGGETSDGGLQKLEAQACTEEPR